MSAVLLLSLHHARAAEHKDAQPTARNLRLRSGFQQRFLPSVWQHTSRAGRGSHFHTCPIPGEGLSMRHGLFLKTHITIFAIVVLTLPHVTVAQSRATETTMATSTIHIPQSVQAEHAAIHSYGQGDASSGTRWYRSKGARRGAPSPLRA